MPPAYRLQHGVGHRLRIDADAVNAVGAQDAQLILGYRVGASGLDGVFPQRAEVEFALQRGAQPVELGGVQRGGRAPAHVN